MANPLPGANRHGVSLEPEAGMIEGWFARADRNGDRIAVFFITHDGREHRWDADHWTLLDGTPIRDRVFWNDTLTGQIAAPAGIPQPD